MGVGVVAGAVEAVVGMGVVMATGVMVVTGVVVATASMVIVLNCEVDFKGKRCFRASICTENRWK